MRKIFTLLTTAFITIFLAGAVLAYDVSIEWDMNQPDYDVEVYQCIDSICSDVYNATPIINDTSSTDVYTTNYTTTGEQYHAVYFYKQGYLVNNYLVHTWNDFISTYSSMFYIKENSTAPILNITTNAPLASATARNVEINVDVESAFKTPANDSGMPIYAPITPAYLDWFTSEIQVTLTAVHSDPTIIIPDLIRILNITESTSEIVPFNLNNMPLGNLTYTITTIVLDNTCNLSTVIPVSAVSTLSITNTLPTISITNPLNNAEFDKDGIIQFRAYATDFEDGDLEAEWRSDEDGYLGTGDINEELSSGNHTITASVTDSDGRERHASISIRVKNGDEEDEEDDGTFVGSYVNLDGISESDVDEDVALEEDEPISLGDDSKTKSLAELLTIPNVILTSLLSIVLITILLTLFLK